VFFEEKEVVMKEGSVELQKEVAHKVQIKEWRLPSEADEANQKSILGLRGCSSFGCGSPGG
jgi:hypothetical protein